MPPEFLLMQEAEVEIIPWVPDFTARVHKELVRHVRRLPKNSAIGIEVTPEELSKMESFFSRPKNEKYFLPTSSRFLASLELVFECKRRGLEVIPLETFSSRLAESRAEEGTILIKREERRKPDAELVSGKMEAAFAGQIKARFKKPGSALPAVVSYNHAIGLSKILEKAGTKTRINTSIFLEGNRVRKLMECHFLYSAAVIEGKEKKISRQYEKLKAVFFPLARQDYNKASEGLRNKLDSAYYSRAERAYRTRGERLEGKPFKIRAKRVPFKRKRLA